MDATILHDLSRAGVILTPDGDRIRATAPPGILTADIRATIATHRDALLTALMDDARALAVTVANARALAQDERAAWEAEIHAAIRWTEAGHGHDPFLAHDRQALRIVRNPTDTPRTGVHGDG